MALPCYSNGQSKFRRGNATETYATSCRDVLVGINGNTLLVHLYALTKTSSSSSIWLRSKYLSRLCNYNIWFDPRPRNVRWLWSQAGFLCELRLPSLSIPPQCSDLCQRMRFLISCCNVCFNLCKIIWWLIFHYLVCSLYLSFNKTCVSSVWSESVWFSALVTLVK